MTRHELEYLGGAEDAAASHVTFRLPGRATGVRRPRRGTGFVHARRSVDRRFTSVQLGHSARTRTCANYSCSGGQFR